MCNTNVLEFFIEEIRDDEFRGKLVLEIGSKYIDGSVRPLVEKFLCPKKYIGADIEPGKYVDVILEAENLVNYFGLVSFDVVIATELLEHVCDWRFVVHNMKDVIKPGGTLFITTRSKGFPFHAYPHDYWRFEIDDMKEIFCDFHIISLKKDYESPGVFLKCRKPYQWKATNLDQISLYSMVLGRRCIDIPSSGDMPFTRKARFVIWGVGKQLLQYTVSILKPRV